MQEGPIAQLKRWWQVLGTVANAFIVDFHFVAADAIGLFVRAGRLFDAVGLDVHGLDERTRAIVELVAQEVIVDGRVQSLDSVYRCAAASARCAGVHRAWRILGPAADWPTHAGHLSRLAHAML